jgi:hypothetical protein
LAIQQALDPVGNPANQTLVQLAIQEIKAWPNWQSSNIIAWPSWQSNKIQAWICWIANWTRPWLAGLPTWHRFCWIGNGQAWVLLDCQLDQAIILLDCQLRQTWMCWIVNWTKPWFAGEPAGPRLCWIANFLLDTPGHAWGRLEAPSWQFSKT